MTKKTPTLDAERLDALVQTALEAWPNLALDPELLSRHILHHASRAADPRRWADELFIEDFALAAACAAGQDDAISTLDHRYNNDLIVWTKRFDGRRYKAEDLRQLFMEKLFVGPSPRILDYSGQGSLHAWMHVTATRLFIDLGRAGTQRRREHLVDAPALDVLPHDAIDLELQFLKREYRAAFQAALRQGAARITPRERTLLRQSYIERMSSDQLGALYGMHRATAARHVQQAREALLSSTREALMNDLKIHRSEFESIMNLIRSRLDVNMASLLEDSISRAEAAS